MRSSSHVEQLQFAHQKRSAFDVFVMTQPAKVCVFDTIEQPLIAPPADPGDSAHSLPLTKNEPPPPYQLEPGIQPGLDIWLEHQRSARDDVRGAGRISAGRSRHDAAGGTASRRAAARPLVHHAP